MIVGLANHLARAVRAVLAGLVARLLRWPYTC